MTGKPENINKDDDERGQKELTRRGEFVRDAGKLWNQAPREIKEAPNNPSIKAKNLAILQNSTGLRGQKTASKNMNSIISMKNGCRTREDAVCGIPA